MCSLLSVSPHKNPEAEFLCLDMVYISVLLEEFGFPPHKELKVRNAVPGPGAGLRVWAWPCINPTPPPPRCVLQMAETIHQVETSWALGAASHYMVSLQRH